MAGLIQVISLQIEDRRLLGAGCRRPHSKTLGFTLIELLICLAIIATLSMIVIPNYLSYRNRAMITVAIQDLRKIQDALLFYYIDYGEYPDSLEEIGLDYMKDPWGNPYQYLRIDGANAKGKTRKDHSLVPVNSDFDLYSMGPDGKSQPPFTAKASRDDIVRAGDGGYFGQASDY